MNKKHKKHKIKNTIVIEHQLTGVKIAFCYGAKAYNEYAKAHFGMNEHIAKDGVSTEFTNNKTGEYAIVVGVRKRKNVYEIKGLLVHELSHTVSQLMQEYGFNCDELRSYTLQWLYQTIMPSLDERLLKDAVKREDKAHKKAQSGKGKKK